MAESVRDFGGVATSLARNPLGIIALFIVLVYGLASLVTTFSSHFDPSERAPLIYFLVLFPVLVLGVFSWLVSTHPGSLFSPADFKDEAHYVQMQQLYEKRVSAVASLTAASTKNPSGDESPDLAGIINAVEKAVPSKPTTITDGWKRRVLWVDDRPENNVYERNAFEAAGISFSLSLNTLDALQQLSQQRFAAVISDMGRKEGPREGYALLDEMRHRGDKTPLFFYASSNAPEHKLETARHGGQGTTNNANELFRMVTAAVIND